MAQVRDGKETYEVIRLGSWGGNSAVDAFGRQRMSEPFTLLDSTLRYSKQTELWDEALTGSATTNYLVNESSLELKTTTASGDIAHRQTKRYLPYEPGKSQRVECSFVMNRPIAGLKQQVGYFDSENGVFLQSNGTAVQIVRRSYVTGSTVDVAVNQADWNLDKLDGTGDSGLVLDVTKANILIMDLEWLGVGGVRIGFVIDNRIVYAHHFKNANNLSTVYMTTATLPVAYRIENTGAIASPATLKQIACTVISEGGYNMEGQKYPALTVPTLKACGTTETLCAAIRLKAGRTKNVVFPTAVSAVSDSNAPFEWKIRLNPTLTGGSWTDAANGRGNVEVNTTATFSGGTIIGSGYVSGGSGVDFPEGRGILNALGVTIGGVSDVLVITVVGSKANAEALANIHWSELY